MSFITQHLGSTPQKVLLLIASFIIAAAAAGAEGMAEEGPDTGESGQSSERVVISNDGMEMVFDSAPERAVTMNQTPTEIMLALELEDRMVGTAYMDDEILPEFAEAYNAIPVLSEKYPSKEVLIKAEPDFVYNRFSSAFSEKRGLATREELLELGINSYLSPSYASNKELRPTPWTVDALYREIREIGKIFRIEERAEAYIEKVKAGLDSAVPDDAHASGKPTVLWLDSFGKNGPYIGAGTGTPHEIINLAGGKNAFADVEGAWATVSQEQIVDRDFEYIVLIEASWDTAESKIENLQKDPIYSELEPVKQEKFVIIDFSASTPGVRLPIAVQKLADALYR
jgi:iron complex transport system substrate-binding protein